MHPSIHDIHFSCNLNYKYIPYMQNEFSCKFLTFPFLINEKAQKICTYEYRHKIAKSIWCALCMRRRKKINQRSGVRFQAWTAMGHRNKAFEMLNDTKNSETFLFVFLWMFETNKFRLSFGSRDEENIDFDRGVICWGQGVGNFRFYF